MSSAQESSYLWSGRWQGNTSVDLWGVSFTDAQRGHAVGHFGFAEATILATTDGGASWTTQARFVPKQVTLRGVSFTNGAGCPSSYPNGCYGHAVGTLNEGITGRQTAPIVATKDGGETWLEQPNPSTQDLHAVFFLDVNRGWTVGAGGTILATGDAGTTWLARPSGTASNLNGVSFLNASRGYAVGDAGTILATSDGGLTWVPQYACVSSSPCSVGSSDRITEHLKAVHFADSSHVYAVGNGGTVLLGDGGTTWARRASGVSADLYGVSGAGSKGYAVGAAGAALATADAGVTWAAEASSTTADLHGAAFPQPDLGYAVGATGTIMKRDLPGPPPTVASVNPSSGPDAGGNEVVITGSGFTGVTQVRFGEEPAASFSVASATELRAIAPAHPQGQVDVTVTTPGGTSSPVAASRYFYRGPLGIWTSCPAETASAGCPGPLNVPRHGPQVILLDPPACHRAIPPLGYPCGNVLVVGGGSDSGLLTSAELYDPATGKWTSCPPPATPSATCPGSLNAPRIKPTATLLLDGKVLIAGGSSANGGIIASAELYDPATGKWTSCPPPATPSATCPAPMGRGRVGHTATLLSPPGCGSRCGMVLVAAGNEPGPTGGRRPTTTTELYDPATGRWSDSGPIRDSRANSSATLLGGSECTGSDPLDYCGKVLLVGGTDQTEQSLGSPPRASTELYNPATGTWMSCPSNNAATSFCPGPLGVARWSHIASSLSDGRVVVAGGNPFGNPLSATEIYNPTRGTWNPARSMTFPRDRAAAARLPGDRILVIGGSQSFGQPQGQRTAEVYDGATGTWRATPPMSQVYPAAHSAVTLADARVLLVEGLSLSVEDGGSTGVELFTPAPEITSLSPTEGPAAGGTDVTIKGFGFADASSVGFGTVQVPASQFMVNAAGTEISVKTPPHEGGTDVTVTVTPAPGKSLVSEPSLEARFTYLGAPGRISDLAAAPLSGREIQLSFSAPGSNGMNPPPAHAYVVKQSSSPITDEAGFATATPLCGGLCTFSPPPGNVGDKVVLSVTDLLPSTTYHYAIKARNGSDLGALSNPAQASTAATTPGKVSDLTAKALSHDKIELSFSAAGDENEDPPPMTEYVIKQSSSPITDAQAFESARTLCSGTCTFAPAKVGDRLTLTVGDLSAETTYHYALRARNSVGNLGGISNGAEATTSSDSSPPGAVNDLIAEGISSRKIELRFSAPGSNGTNPPPASEYVIKQSRSAIKDEEGFRDARTLCGGVCTFAPSKVGDELRLRVGDLSPETTYHYALKARDDAGNLGPMSNGAKVKTSRDIAPPHRVTGVKAKALSAHKIRLRFRAAGSDGSEPPPATRYIVKQARRPIANSKRFRRARTLCKGGCVFQPSSVGDVIKLKISHLRPNTTYYYSIRAKDDAGNRGPRSKTVRARTQARRSR